MASGTLIAREFFNPDQRSAVRLPTPALPGCTPMQADKSSIRSVFWYSETDVLPSHLSQFLPGRALVAAAPADGSRLLTSSRGEDGEPLMAADKQNQQDNIPDKGEFSWMSKETICALKAGEP